MTSRKLIKTHLFNLAYHPSSFAARLPFLNTDVDCRPSELGPRRSWALYKSFNRIKLLSYNL